MKNKGEIFKKIREYLGLSQKAMGEKLGCSAAKYNGSLVKTTLEEIIVNTF